MPTWCEVVDVTGLYLSPPDKALVLVADEKSRVSGPRTDPACVALATRIQVSPR